MNTSASSFVNNTIIRYVIFYVSIFTKAIIASIYSLIPKACLFTQSDTEISSSAWPLLSNETIIRITSQVRDYNLSVCFLTRNHMPFLFTVLLILQHKDCFHAILYSRTSPVLSWWPTEINGLKKKHNIEFLKYLSENRPYQNRFKWH